MALGSAFHPLKRPKYRLIYILLSRIVSFHITISTRACRSVQKPLSHSSKPIAVQPSSHETPSIPPPVRNIPPYPTPPHILLHASTAENGKKPAHPPPQIRDLSRNLQKQPHQPATSLSGTFGTRYTHTHRSHPCTHTLTHSPPGPCATSVCARFRSSSRRRR